MAGRRLTILRKALSSGRGVVAFRRRICASRTTGASFQARARHKRPPREPSKTEQIWSDLTGERSKQPISDERPIVPGSKAGSNISRETSAGTTASVHRAAMWRAPSLDQTGPVTMRKGHEGTRGCRVDFSGAALLRRPCFAQSFMSAWRRCRRTQGFAMLKTYGRAPCAACIRSAPYSPFFSAYPPLTPPIQKSSGASISSPSAVATTATRPAIFSASRTSSTRSAAPRSASGCRAWLRSSPAT